MASCHTLNGVLQSPCLCSSWPGLPVIPNITYPLVLAVLFAWNNSPESPKWLGWLPTIIQIFTQMSLFSEVFPDSTDSFAFYNTHIFTDFLFLSCHEGRDLHCNSRTLPGIQQELNNIYWINDCPRVFSLLGLITPGKVNGRRRRHTQRRGGMNACDRVVPC